jgi:hypothetical protein
MDSSSVWLGCPSATSSLRARPRARARLTLWRPHKLLGVTEPDPRPKPSLRATLSNWSSYDAPFPTKLRMVVSNNLIKLRKRQDCCGNYGQPGC